MKKNKVSLNLEDLRVESFETLPELTDAQTGEILGDVAGCQEYTCQNTCYAACNTGNETVVCCYPTQGNGSRQNPATKTLCDWTIY